MAPQDGPPVTVKRAYSASRYWPSASGRAGRTSGSQSPAIASRRAAGQPTVQHSRAQGAEPPAPAQGCCRGIHLRQRRARQPANNSAPSPDRSSGSSAPRQRKAARRGMRGAGDELTGCRSGWYWRCSRHPLPGDKEATARRGSPSAGWPSAWPQQAARSLPFATPARRGWAGGPAEATYRRRLQPDRLGQWWPASAAERQAAGPGRHQLTRALAAAAWPRGSWGRRIRLAIRPRAFSVDRRSPRLKGAPGCINQVKPMRLRSMAASGNIFAAQSQPPSANQRRCRRTGARMGHRRRRRQTGSQPPPGGPEEAQRGNDDGQERSAARAADGQRRDRRGVAHGPAGRRRRPSTSMSGWAGGAAPRSSPAAGSGGERSRAIARPAKISGYRRLLTSYSSASTMPREAPAWLSADMQLGLPPAPGAGRRQTCGIQYSSIMDEASCAAVAPLREGD